MLKNIQEMAKNYNGVEDVVKELRKVQTQKCRLKKQKARQDYEVKMSELLDFEQSLKEVKEYFEPKKTFVTMMSKSDIDELNYEETMKAIKSIQSKKCNSQWDEDQSDYEKACEIEEMLLEHKNDVKPIEDTVVKKSTIQNVIRHLENQEEMISTKYVMELLQKVMNDEDCDL